MSDKQRPRTTTDAGIPTASDEHSLTIGPDGPILLQDHYLIQKMAQFNRERMPERVVHAKGGGAHGFFEVTEDVTQYCKADFLYDLVGNNTPIFSCATHPSFRTSSTPRSACRTPTCAATTPNGTSGPCRPSQPTRSVF
jgi:catalase